MKEKWLLTEFNRAKSKKDEFQIRVERGDRICVGFAKDKAATFARARLMAAAPDLQDALINVLENGLNRATFEQGLAAIEKSRSKPA